MEEAAVMMVGLKAERILQGLAILEGQTRGENRLLRLVEDYSMPNVSEKSCAYHYELHRLCKSSDLEEVLRLKQ